MTGYQVYFRCEPIEDAFATLTTDQVQKMATVTLNSKLQEEQKSFEHVERSAKHEAIHLLVERLESLARRRYIRPDEITEATEELVVKLGGLIKC